MKHIKSKLLLIDDDVSFLNVMPHYLGEEFEYLLADNVEFGLAKLKENPDLILLDVEMDSETDGIHAIPRIKEIDPEIPVIMLTRHSDYKLVVRALKNGAADYFVKSPETDELKGLIFKTLEMQMIKQEVRYLKTEISAIKGRLTGDSEVMKKLYEEIQHAASLDCPVLITGETGVGKELVAREIHLNSRRCDRPYITVNVSGFTNELFSSELFGHEKGAFTGAVQRKKGLIETAGSGTIFLDEIGNLSIESQVKLLRVIEEKEVRRVGGIQNLPVPARIITATNQDLSGLIDKELFRKDLFYRLNVFTIHVPPLRERKEDIPILTDYFINKSGNAKISLDVSLTEFLMSYDWPGNVRQLKNFIEIISGCGKENRIDLDFAKRFLMTEPENSKTELQFSEEYFSLNYRTSKEKILNTFTKQYVNFLINKTGGNISKAAELSGLARSSFYKLLDEEIE